MSAREQRDKVLYKRGISTLTRYYYLPPPSHSQLGTECTQWLWLGRRAMAVSQFYCSGAMESLHYKSQGKLIDFGSRRSFNSRLLLARTLNLNQRTHRSRHRRSVLVTNVIKDPDVAQGKWSSSCFDFEMRLRFFWKLFSVKIGLWWKCVVSMMKIDFSVQI